MWVRNKNQIYVYIFQNQAEDTFQREVGDGNGRRHEVMSVLHPKGLRKLNFKVTRVLVYQLMCNQQKKKKFFLIKKEVGLTH